MNGPNGSKGGWEKLVPNNLSSVTSMVATIIVAQSSPATTYYSMSNNFPGGYLSDTERTAGGFITYTFLLQTNHTIPANYRNHYLYARFKGDNTSHSTTGDSWSVTSTSGGVTSTVSGHF
jgi:hypothetical protein